MLGLDLGADESDDGEEFAPAGKKITWLFDLNFLKNTGLFNLNS